MKKTENTKTVKTFAELEKKIDILFDYDANEKITAILNEYDRVDENSSPAKIQKVWEIAKPVIDELKNGNIEKSATAVKSFKWLKLENYKRENLAVTTFENVAKNDKIVFHYAKNVMENLIKINYGYMYYDGGKVDDITTIDFKNDVDICTVISIKNGEIKLKSDTLGGVYYLYADNFQNEKKNKICCNDDGIPFALYKKIA